MVEKRDGTFVGDDGEGMKKVRIERREEMHEHNEYTGDLNNS